MVVLNGAKLGGKAASILLASSLCAIAGFGLVRPSLAETTPAQTLSAEKKAECSTLKKAVQRLNAPLSKTDLTPADTSKELKAIAKGIQDVKVTDSELKTIQSGFAQSILELAETVLKQNTSDFRSAKLQPAVEKFFKDLSPVAKKAGEICPGV
ncbi:hypothetical protein V2H45_14530 [Tumidithrix elongata RA019]|uniref:Secreted protein n=1 Tax=Tumidithrix elongata BACA0141 TaxID=2716417 RepID=A0AAW9Q410_9CYAN|nr:hypothetical protein [Tumidithrix elongata RA019]